MNFSVCKVSPVSHDLIDVWIMNLLIISNHLFDSIDGLVRCKIASLRVFKSYMLEYYFIYIFTEIKEMQVTSMDIHVTFYKLSKLIWIPLIVSTAQHIIQINSFLATFQMTKTCPIS